MSSAIASVPVRDRLSWSRPSSGSLPQRPGVNTTSAVVPPASGKSGGVHLSHSQCRTYAGCSLQWFLSRRYPPEFVPANLLFGASFHAAMDAYYQARLEGRDAGLDDLLAAFSTHWAEELAGVHGHGSVPVKFSAKDESEDNLRALAERMISAFLEYQKGRTSQVIAIEEGFRIDLDADLPSLVGKIDLIELETGSDGTRRLCLTDFKTAAKKPTLDDLGSDQAQLYGRAAVGMGLVNAFQLPLALRYLVVTKTKNPEVHVLEVENSPRDWRRLTEKIRQCWRGMRAQVVFPSPSWRCSGCGHARLCGAWPVLEAVPTPLAASA